MARYRDGATGFSESYLFEAATVVLYRTKKWSSLKAWGMKLAKANRREETKVAIARKIAVISTASGSTARRSTGAAKPPDRNLIGLLVRSAGLAMSRWDGGRGDLG